MATTPKNLSLAFIVTRSDGFETYGIRGFTSAAKAHLYACKESVNVYGDDLCLSADNDGVPVLRATYVNGNCVTMWYPPE